MKEVWDNSLFQHFDIYTTPPSRTCNPYACSCLDHGATVPHTIILSSSKRLRNGVFFYDAYPSKRLQNDVFYDALHTYSRWCDGPPKVSQQQRGAPLVPLAVSPPSVPARHSVNRLLPLPSRSQGLLSSTEFDVSLSPAYTDGGTGI